MNLVKPYIIILHLSNMTSMTDFHVLLLSFSALGAPSLTGEAALQLLVRIAYNLGSLTWRSIYPRLMPSALRAVPFWVGQSNCKESRSVLGRNNFSIILFSMISFSKQDTERKVFSRIFVLFKRELWDIDLFIYNNNNNNKKN
jgi:hypothetical protein